MWSSNRNGVSLARVGGLLGAEVLTGDQLLSRRVYWLSVTDMMSRVLAESVPGTLLITGLANIQVINTAELASLSGVVFVKGARPPEDVLRRAANFDVPCLLTGHSSNEASNILDQWGLRRL